jgi:haloalkane dehalogenase
MSLSLHAQEWLDTTLYPFENKYTQLDAGKMHYIDEGEGDVILFIHGTPTWSFLYRNYVSELSKNYRCIAIDHIGFGLSEKPEEFDGTPQSHSKNLTAFIEKLNLTNITLVVHDFGGPIGISAAIQNQTRIKQMVVFNTWLWETKDNPSAQKVDKILNSGIGKFLYLRMNFSPKVLLKKGISDKSNLSKKVHSQYIKPFPNKSSRLSLLRIGKSLVGSSDWYQKQWEQLHKLDYKPWLILWGTKDEFITMEYLQKWKNRLPNATVKEYSSGHFLQEEKANETILEIKKLMKK